MDSPEETVQLVIAESERLIQYLNTLSPEAWRTPSACDRWEVRDVVAHLAGQGQFYADMIAQSLQGDASTPEGRPAGYREAGAVGRSGARRIAQNQRPFKPPVGQSRPTRLGETPLLQLARDCPAAVSPRPAAI